MFLTVFTLFGRQEVREFELVSECEDWFKERKKQVKKSHPTGDFPAKVYKVELSYEVK